MEVYGTWCLNTDMVEDWAYFDNAFTTEECDALIEYGRSCGLKNAETGSNNEVDLLIRKSKVSFLPPTEFMVPYYQKISAIVHALNDQYFKFDLHGFVEHLQFTEYEAPGGKYESHVDRGYNIPVRKLSIVLQLTDSDDYEGGDLEWIPQIEKPHKLPRTRGTLLAFPSFQLHRVTPVTKGTRNSLVGWINGKQFR